MQGWRGIGLNESENVMPLIEQEIKISIGPREDGGVRVWSDDMPGLILSGSDPLKVMAAIGPAIKALIEYKRDHPVAFAN